MDPLVLARPISIPADLSLREKGRLRSQAASDLLIEAMHLRGLEPWVPQKEARGAPLPHQGWHISKSHCPDYLAAALATGPIGIDVEPIRWSRLANWGRVVDDAERKVLGELTPLSFTRLWTAKEAVLKADGIGIGGLSGCRLREVRGPECLVLRHEGVDRVVHQKILANHVLSVYANGSETVSWSAPHPPSVP